MQLVDCFVELIAYVSYLLKALPADQPNFERVKNDIARLISTSTERCQAGSIAADDFQLAQFAVLAWIDEAILNSAWLEKTRWQGEQLQRTYFQTADAGELFFDKLNMLQPHQLQVREVYYICLALGFTGRYCNPGDEILLNQLKHSNLKLLGGAAGSDIVQGGSPLFPEGYGDGSGDGLSGKRGGFGIGAIFGAIAPVLLFALLFGIYQFVLSNVGENLIRSIR